MKWRLIWTRAAERDLDALDRIAAQRILRALHRFCETGHADVACIVNTTPPRRRIRVGPHRIIIVINEDPGEVEIIRIHRRDSAY